MKTKYRHTIMSPPETIIRKFGYEWILIEGSDRKGTVHPQPCMFGMPNMALKSVRKIKK
jgi:hypothetical protein